MKVTSLSVENVRFLFTADALGVFSSFFFFPFTSEVDEVVAEIFRLLKFARQQNQIKMSSDKTIESTIDDE